MVRGLGDGELRLGLKGARLLLELLLQSGDGLLTLGDVVLQPALRILPGKFCRGVALGDLCRELDDARIARREFRLHLAFGLCLDELCGLALLLVELLGKLGVAHLACDLRITRLVHLKDGVTFGTFDFVHGVGPFNRVDADVLQPSTRH